MWHYELFQDEAGRWRWHLRAGNGRLVCTSGEAFATRSNAERAVHQVRAQAGQATLPAPQSAELLARLLAGRRGAA